MPLDRRATLRGQQLLNGIDFVYVDPTQTRLVVTFLSTSPDSRTLKDSFVSASIRGGATIPNVAVTETTWGATPAGYPTLELVVAAPGDFSTYALKLVTSGPNGPTLDPFFDHVDFSFKANCPSTLDCEQPPIERAARADASPPIDYLAKDFDSFRKALSDFSALRYPAWQERSEGDFGVMFMEALSSLADDLSYQQDRIAAEGWIETATQRRSLVRLARLVDYEPRTATAARVWLQFEMAGSVGCSIPGGLAVSALAPDGTLVDFETGMGLGDGSPYATHPTWNKLQPHWFDDDRRCLRSGAVQMWVRRPAQALEVGRTLLIDTPAASSADLPDRQLVRLVEVDNSETDLLYNMPLTRIVWRAEDALQVDHDLSNTTVAGNIVPATHGRSCTDHFVASTTWSVAPDVPRALVRTGANNTPQFLHTLRNAPLAWLAQDGALEDPRPELRVVELNSAGPRKWEWRRRLLDAGEFEEAVTLDPVRYRDVDAGTGFMDYDGGDGATLRFGDGVFGAIPVDGTLFEVTYRSGGGARGNVAAATLTRLDATHPVAPNILSVTNPLPAAGGRAEEPADRVREMAPQRFRATQYRAVRSEDYARAAMTLDWVQRAGTRFRYTGSWLSVFTTADPRGSTTLADDRVVALTELLDRYRLAGYESFALAPRYASLDLDIAVCARPDAFRGEVTRAVLAALDSATHMDGTRGFFHPDRFTFGVALERSAIEAVLNEIPSVDGVVDLRYRRRGHTPGFIVMPDSVEVGTDEIVRVENDPSRPEHGSLRIDVRGGK